MPKQYIIQRIGTGMHFIMLDAPTVRKMTKDGNKRVICTINETEAVHAAVMSRKGEGHFIQIGLRICKKLKLKAGSVVTARFTIDTTTYQFEMPEEFAEVLRTDPEADKIFHGLTEGNQRGLIYLVAKVKSSDKKIEKALHIAAQLRKGITSPRVILK